MVLRVDDLEDLADRGDVDPPGAGIALLGRQLLYLGEQTGRLGLRHMIST